MNTDNPLPPLPRPSNDVPQRALKTVWKDGIDIDELRPWLVRLLESYARLAISEQAKRHEQEIAEIKETSALCLKLQLEVLQQEIAQRDQRILEIEATNKRLRVSWYEDTDREKTRALAAEARVQELEDDARHQEQMRMSPTAIQSIGTLAGKKIR